VCVAAVAAAIVIASSPSNIQSTATWRKAQVEVETWVGGGGWMAAKTAASPMEGEANFQMWK